MQLSEDLHQLRLYQYFDGIALAIYLYDYSLTFARELELIWASKWTTMKSVFLFDRYFIIVNFIIQHLLLTTRPTTGCQGLGEAFAYVTLIGVFLSETILSLRLWVMWRNDKRVLVGLLAMFTGTTVLLAYFGAKYFGDGIYKFKALPYDIKGCVFDTQIKNWYNTYFVNLILDAVVLIMALIPTIRICEGDAHVSVPSLQFLTALCTKTNRTRELLLVNIA
ncbi:hypothetical protein P691DRAFT_765532 [Macrolepiota fuliginosa MF-IS2]|uniref:DUF6533 domain-containing protein n=1 Tax=Macrolepiota fuliginosa MF-IS2 TaxID=1400762 RepID=A0A9P6BWP8_9AGAR|nr:hypothetical protein P691DRAFT_765532 [Macrolepiota fuliginosa MF-IS2]